VSLRSCFFEDFAFRKESDLVRRTTKRDEKEVNVVVSKEVQEENECRAADWGRSAVCCFELMQYSY
jgi:hypothetical protein